MALHRRPAECRWVKQVTISLSSALTDSNIDLEGAHLAAFSVLALTGAATVAMDGGNALPLVKGQDRGGFDAETFTITTDGSVGGTVTLELHGRY